MTDPLRHLQPGDPLPVKAETLNAFIDAALAHRERRRLAGGDPRKAWPASATRLLVKNISGEDLAALRALQLEDAVIAPQDNESEFRAKPALTATKAAEPRTGHWCVLSEPIANGHFGFAYVAGVFPAVVDVSTEADEEQWRRVDLQADATVLELLSQGAGRVLWREGGTGEQLALVSLVGEGGSCLPRSEHWTLGVAGKPTGGTFDFTFTINEVEETKAIAWNADAAAIKTALESHSEVVSGDVEVIGGPLPNANVIIQWQGEQANKEMVQPQYNWDSLTGGSGVLVVSIMWQSGVAA